MTVVPTSTEVILQQMDRLLEEDDISTKNGLRFAFTVLREALAVVASMEKRVMEAEGAYKTVVKNSSDVATRFETVVKRVDAMWTGYQIGIWAATVIGVSVIGLIWSLITGVATITFGGSP